jgi:predicted nucleotidyltransferase
MMSTTPPGLLATLSRALAGRAEVELALLFGSTARGQAGPGSDVDVAVRGLAGDAVDRLGLAADLSAAARCEVDLVDLDEASYPMLRALLRDAIVLHEGRPGAGADWRTRAILETETDRPWFERMRDAYLAHLAAGGRG